MLYEPISGGTAFLLLSASAIHRAAYQGVTIVSEYGATCLFIVRLSPTVHTHDSGGEKKRG